MTSNPNKLSQFWQELRRRKVTRVITIYIAAAFMALELVDILSDPFGLPELSLKVAFFILIAGLILSIIISWIYDIHPDEGIMKTEAANEVSGKALPPSSKGWKIASYISFVVIVGLIVLNILPRTGKKDILDKSIAVLPFIDDSPDKNNEHIINGIMEDLLINLQTIKDLRVPGRTTTERYRDNPKQISEIADEMNVSYIVEGSGQRYGNKLRLRVQLVEGSTDKQIWAKSYDEVISGPEDIFRIQSQLAEYIAKELQAVITPEEMELIEKVPTTNLTALVFYKRGRDEYFNYVIKNDPEALERAEKLYFEALKNDSAFAQAYAGLAIVYWNKKDMSDFFAENRLDSVLILANLALSYDEQSSEAYIVRGRYYWEKGKGDLALADFEKAIHLNPNYGEAYRWIGHFYQYSDFVKAIESYHKAVSIDRGQSLIWSLQSLGMEYWGVGFIEKSNHYYNEALKLHGDSALYYYVMAQTAAFSGEINVAIDYSRRAILLDSTTSRRDLAGALLQAGKHKEALEIYKKLHESGEVEIIRNAQRIAYAYWINGLEEEAEYYFDKQIEYSLELINTSQLWAQAYFSFYDLAGVYAFRGEREKAYENLRAFNQIKEVPFWAVDLIKRDELFDNIRDEPEFQQIVRDVEAKYQASHERVLQWMEENDIL